MVDLRSRVRDKHIWIKVDADPGAPLAECFVQMGELANQTGVKVEMAANDCRFYAYPGDTETELRAAFMRLYYPKGGKASRAISVFIGLEQSTPSPALKAVEE